MNSGEKSNIRRNYEIKNGMILLFFGYALSFGVTLLNKGIYLDDWAFKDTSIIIDVCQKIGITPIGYLLAFLLSFPSVEILFRIYTFIAFLLSALCLNKILENIPEVATVDRVLIVIFFAIFPINFARMMMMTLHYKLCHFFFFLAFWMLSKYLNKKKLLLRIISLCIFYFSFFTSSLLVFYSIVIFYILYIERKNITSIISFFKRGVLRYVDFFLLPVGFWSVRNLFFKPSGTYGDYNQIHLEHIYLMFKNFHHVFYDSFIHPIFYAFDTIIKREQVPIFLSFLLLALIIYFVFKNTMSTDRSAQYRKHEVFMLIGGGGIFWIAVFPYYAVKKIPRLFDWGDRHHLLVPLGAAVIIVYAVKIIVKPQMRPIMYAFLIALSIFANFLTYLDYQKDWFKQLSLIEQIKASEIMKNNTTFLFYDSTTDLNAMQRKYLVYEYTGMMKVAFGDENRLGMNADKFCKRFKNDRNAFFRFAESNAPYPYFHMRQYQPHLPEYKIIIKHGKHRLTRKTSLKLLYQHLFAPQIFQANIKRILSLETVPFNETLLQDVCRL